jgi:ubiquinone/menaquinone biosynthesis C-methylase UbiE
MESRDRITEEQYCYLKEKIYKDKRRESWERGIIPRERDRLQRYLPAGSHILDEGCGRGLKTVNLVEMGYKVTAIDIDKGGNALPSARELALKKGMDIEFNQGDVSRLPYPDAMFDGIFSAGVLHHIYREGWEEKLDATIEEMARVLRNDGIAYVSTPFYLRNATPSWMKYLRRGVFLKPKEDFVFNYPKFAPYVIASLERYFKIEESEILKVKKKSIFRDGETHTVRIIAKKKELKDIIAD